ncbi:MAG: hypothetical protein AAGK78_04035, partial [Planctomycetota bacterium]
DHAARLAQKSRAHATREMQVLRTGQLNQINFQKLILSADRAITPLAVRTASAFSPDIRARQSFLRVRRIRSENTGRRQCRGIFSAPPVPRSHSAFSQARL